VHEVAMEARNMTMQMTIKVFFMIANVFLDVVIKKE